MLDAFFEYWKNEKHMIDYFLIDYYTYIAFERFPKFKKIILSNPLDNTDICNLQERMNDVFSHEHWEKLFNKQTLHKMSYKLPLRKGDTIANYLIKNL